MIYIIEGADGTNKTTFCKSLANKLGEMGWKSHYLHNSYRPDEDIAEYLLQTSQVMGQLAQANEALVVDRWWPSEEAYSSVFRDNYPGTCYYSKMKPYRAWMRMQARILDAKYILLAPRDYPNGFRQKLRTDSSKEMYKDVKKMEEVNKFFIKHRAWFDQVITIPFAYDKYVEGLKANGAPKDIPLTISKVPEEKCEKQRFFFIVEASTLFDTIPYSHYDVWFRDRQEFLGLDFDCYTMASGKTDHDESRLGLFSRLKGNIVVRFSSYELAKRHEDQMARLGFSKNCDTFFK